jgi:hypothetical protein
MINEVTRIAEIKGCSTIKYWFENCIETDEIEEMPIPS